jgi:intracellular septation protein
MKFLFDFFPILLFFIAFKMYDIFVATGVAIAATLVQNGWFWYRNRRFETMHIITLVLIIVFGGATILLHDEEYIKWKVSVVNWLFGMVFLGSQFIGEKSIIERMMSKNIKLKANIWSKLNLSWALFFIAVGFINVWVMYNFDTPTWVNFKLFGTIGLTIVFVVAQSIYLGKYIDEDAMNQMNKEKEKE